MIKYITSTSLFPSHVRIRSLLHLQLILSSLSCLIQSSSVAFVLRYITNLYPKSAYNYFLCSFTVSLTYLTSSWVPLPSFLTLSAVSHSESSNSPKCQFVCLQPYCVGHTFHTSTILGFLRLCQTLKTLHLCLCLSHKNCKTIYLGFLINLMCFNKRQ